MSTKWAAVQTPVTGQLHIVEIASVCQHWTQTSSSKRISMNGSLKQYDVDTAREVWAVLASNEPMDERNS